MEVRPERTGAVDTTVDDPWRGANPLDPAFRLDPYPALKRLREIEPVHETPLGIWRLSRYSDCVRMLRDLPVGVRRTDGTLPGVDESKLENQRNFMLQQDPPNHTRLRKLVSRAFTPRAVSALEPAVDRIVTECLDRIETRHEFDVIADLALPVPATLICEMLGVPRGDRDRFTVWTAEATHGLAAQIAPPDVLDRARQAGLSLGAYFENLIEERRGSLGDDILSGMIRAEEDGDTLSHQELISQSIGLLIAGFETTIGLIGNGTRQLLLHPDELAKLRADPRLIESAIEECLRFDGPIPLTLRIPHQDIDFGEQVIPKDSTVMVLLAAANRDPERFPEPERFDITRDPNPHIAFGGGTHLCLGTHLARMEARAAIGGLFRRFPRLQLQSETLELGPSLFRVPGRLPVAIAT
ncbi:MAG: cytochrome P450 [Deltaproteobacteria bacterium]|nr:cytochrome P450 [Deltaproteobacteria bacterium]